MLFGVLNNEWLWWFFRGTIIYHGILQIYGVCLQLLLLVVNTVTVGKHVYHVVTCIKDFLLHPLQSIYWHDSFLRCSRSYGTPEDDCTVGM